MTRKVPVAVVVPTFNEEANLPACLASVASWADQVFVLDSWSTDRTPQIAKEHGADVVNVAFEGYAHMRNFALRNLPFRHEWILFLDADERATPEFAEAVRRAVAEAPGAVAGYYVNRRFHFMGRWIRRGGYYPVWILRLVRHARARCEERAVNEHLVVDGEVRRLEGGDLVHEDLRDVSYWIVKHDKYALLEARELLRKEGATAARALGDQAGRKRWLREKGYNRLPPLVRPFLYFGYRYVLRLGFLDGRAGFVYHFLQGLWWPFLVDVKYLELKRQRR